MKFVIFSDRSYNYIKPVSEGLVKMLSKDGHECIVYQDGIYWLQKLNVFKVLFADIYRFFLNIRSGKKDLYIYRFLGLFSFMSRRKKKEILECDAIIIVLNCPTAFYSYLPRIEELREFGKPIVNYDLHYLPNQGWFKKIKEQNSHNFGLERYDWYLPGSLVTEYALPVDIPKIYSNIGFDLRSDNLYPEQKEFVALLDFSRYGYEAEREIQIRALKETNTPYVELKGRYTANDIRAVYRQSSIYFIACRESFGLPVIELQLCGCSIFTPYSNWLPAHFLGKDLHEAGDGTLGQNFFVYENNLETLKVQILELKKNHDYKLSVEKFKEDYPGYYSGNQVELREFINKLENKEITENSHKLYERYNSYISVTDDVCLVSDK